MATQTLIIDQVLADYDVSLTEHTVVDADPRTTLDTARNLDFLTVRTPLLTAAMWVRGLPGLLTRRPMAVPDRLTLAGGVGLPGWLSLGESADEVAFGAVGRFWQPNIEWRDVPPAEFSGFREPGWGRIACNFSVRPYGTGRTLLTYECRTATTDAEAHRQFGRYWWLIRPFVGHIMRATLATIARNAARPRAGRPA